MRAEPVGDVVEVDALLDRLAERLVHDRDRADPAYRLLERRLGVGAVHPPGLQPQQRGDGLQVVLHPVVDLADGGVLGDQLAVAAAQVGDVADQDQRADQPPVRAQRDGPHDQRHRLGAELGVPVGPAAEHRAERLLVGPQPRRHQLAGHLGQAQPVEVAGEAEPAVDRERVRAGVDDPALLVDAQEAVADPRGVRVVAALARDREVAAGDHLGQVGRGLQVGQLQPARGADAEQVGVAADHGDHPPAAAHRDRLGAHRHVVAPLRVALADQPALGVRDVEVRPPAGRARRCRRCRRRTPSGRWWAASGRPPRSRVPSRSGSHSTRSAKLRSAMICQSAWSSWSQATSSASRSVWARTSSIRDATQVSVGVARWPLRRQARFGASRQDCPARGRQGILWQDGSSCRGRTGSR